MCHARIAHQAGITPKTNQIVLTAKRGLSSDSLQCLQRKAIRIHVWKNSTPLSGIFNNYKEKLSVAKVQTAAC